MKLTEMLANQPEIRRIPNARFLARQSLAGSRKRLAVVDDDPTGTQTTHGIGVFMKWSVDVLRKSFASGAPVFFISTNSRSLSPQEAREVSLEVGHNLRVAAQLEGVEVILASRSDSTLRGHFPYEVDALASGLGQALDGIIIVPAFFEGGRYTIDDIHFVEQEEKLIPAHETEFARDPVFGFKNSNLKSWVTEKMGGDMAPQNVGSISLQMLREGGPEAVAQMLTSISKGKPVIVNAACYDDLDVLVAAILLAEQEGKKFAYRCAASFVKARGGFTDKPLLTQQDFVMEKGPGLIVVGSYVEKTSRQLQQLTASGLARGIEIKVSELQDKEKQDIEIESVTNAINQQLANGTTTVLYTSRTVDLSNRNFLEVGNNIIISLCKVMQRIYTQPGYIIAKGGITSIELARSGLGVEEALVLGQIIKGVPVWQLGKESRWAGIPYVVFPGNVGGDGALLSAVEILQGLSANNK